LFAYPAGYAYASDWPPVSDQWELNLDSGAWQFSSWPHYLKLELTATPVPEPSALAMLLVCGTFVARRRMRRAT